MMFENHLKSLIFLFLPIFREQRHKGSKRIQVSSKKSEFPRKFTLRKSVKIGKIEK